MPRLRTIAATRDRGFAILPRLALAADLALDAARALHLRAHIGSARIEETLPPSLLAPAAIIELAAAALLTLGLATRPAAAIPLILAFISAAPAFQALGGLGSATALDSLARAALIAAAAAFLIVEGGGRWSMDAAFLATKPRRRTAR